MSWSISRAVLVVMLLAACRSEPPPATARPATAPVPTQTAVPAPAPLPTASEPDASPPPAPPVSPHLRCSVDADCTLSTFTCSRCGRCPGPPAIVSVAWENEQRARCAEQQKQGTPGRRDPPPRCAPCRPLPEGAEATWPKAARCDDGVCGAAP